MRSKLFIRRQIQYASLDSEILSFILLKNKQDCLFFVLRHRIYHSWTGGNPVTPHPSFPHRRKSREPSPNPDAVSRYPGYFCCLSFTNLSVIPAQAGIQWAMSRRTLVRHSRVGGNPGNPGTTPTVMVPDAVSRYPGYFCRLSFTNLSVIPAQAGIQEEHATEAEIDARARRKSRVPNYSAFVSQMRRNTAGRRLQSRTD